MKSFLPPLLLRIAWWGARRISAGGVLPTWFARGLLAIAQRRASAGQRVDRDTSLANDDALRDQLGFTGDAA